MNKTVQREAILSELRKMNTHPTADELYAVLRPKVPQISLGTIYRNLEDMANRGVIRKLELTGRQKRFDGDASPHYHARCRACDRVFNLAAPRLDEVDKLLASLMPELGCSGVYLEWSGLCPACREKEQQLQNQKAKEVEQDEKREVVSLSAVRTGR